MLVAPVNSLLHETCLECLLSALVMNGFVARLLHLKQFLLSDGLGPIHRSLQASSAIVRRRKCIVVPVGGRRAQRARVILSAYIRVIIGRLLPILLDLLNVSADVVILQHIYLVRLIEVLVCVVQVDFGRQVRSHPI